MPRPSTYSRPAAIAVARYFAEGGSLRRACRLLPNDHSRLSRWKDLHPEFRALLELAAVLRTIEGGDSDVGRELARVLRQALYAPPGKVRNGMWKFVERMGRSGGPFVADQLLEELWEARTEMEHLK
ncbi:MAG: hypothetical protein ACYSUN_08735 [Planctomycetota bacterium]|jgi:hypothetical protein